MSKVVEARASSLDRRGAIPKAMPRIPSRGTIQLAEKSNINRTKYSLKLSVTLAPLANFCRPRTSYIVAAANIMRVNNKGYNQILIKTGKENTHKMSSLWICKAKRIAFLK